MIFSDLRHSLSLIIEAQGTYQRDYDLKLKMVLSGNSKEETLELIKGYSVVLTKTSAVMMMFKGDIVSRIDSGGGLNDDGYQLPNIRPFSKHELIQNFDNFDQLVKMITLRKSRQQLKWNNL
ncbi:hypothetical protein GD1_33 [Paraglaciecola Antarctic GD virus 1]|nr:hypothetical protein GD1_33 [Paraglaciecola Antarctic GD virus 1]